MDECFLKLAASLPLKIGRGPKRNFIFQLSIFRGYVGFRECNIGCFFGFNSCYGFYVSCFKWSSETGSLFFCNNMSS